MLVFWPTKCLPSRNERREIRSSFSPVSAFAPPAPAADQATHGERDFRFCHHTARTRRNREPRVQQFTGAGVIAELGHRDAAQREGGRALVQGNVIECGQWITGSQGADGRGGEGGMREG